MRTRTELLVDGMSCGHCAAAVTRAVQALDPAAQIEVDLDHKQVRVDSALDRAALARAIADAGYAPAPAGAA